ncbi:MAG: response regulator [Clostridiales bacterium]|nr:response regulator [Clostridiales bacterium]
MRSFRVRITILIVLVVIVSAGLLSFMSYRRAEKSVFTQSEEKYRVSADKYAQELTTWLNANASIVDTLAANIEYSRFFDQDGSFFHDYLKSVYDSLNSKGYIYDIYFTFPDNTMACASDFVSDGSVDFAHERDWYMVAAETNELYYSSPYLDSDTKATVITISKAVRADGELKGIIAADIFVDVLVDIINEAEVAEDSYAFLVDQNMGMVVHPNSAYSFSDKPIGLLQLPGSPYGEVVANIRKNSDGTVYLKDYDGVTRGIVVSKMENSGWYVGIATSKAEMMKGMDGLVTTFLIAAIVSALIGGTCTVFLAFVLDKNRRQQQEYAEKVLRLEKQAADEASEAKSRFLADMSHEIRTPINAILGMNEMITRETENREIMGYSRNIRQSGQNLLALVNSILDFSKIENGKMELVCAPYNVKTQISYVVNSISERARAKKLELVLDIDPTIPTELFGDNTRINEVVMNLLTNAVKYTEKGTVTLAIKGKERKAPEADAPAEEREGESILLYFEVTDTGIGIKEEDMKRLFESFERLDVERNRNIEGTGLGMSVCTKLLGLMNSELKVRSKYGEGSTFWFELWQKIDKDEPIGDFDVVNAEEEDEEIYREKFHAPTALILIVDDTKMNISVAANLLKKTDVRINTALSGQEAIRLAGENQYDLILMDQRMPGMDGTEAMQEIRKLPGKLNEKTPIICLTADVIRGARERYIQQGFDGYLTKPIDGYELEKTLLTHLPKEKIQIVERPREEAAGPGDEKTAELFEALAKAGVDPKTGLFFCQGDTEMYKSILSEFCQEKKSKFPNLISCYEKHDWKNYEIYIHSLKSTSKTIGAKKLFEMAADLETAAGRGNEMALADGHAKAMDLYEKIVTVIEEHLEVPKDETEEDDEIFEFFPEEN